MLVSAVRRKSAELAMGVLMRGIGNVSVKLAVALAAATASTSVLAGGLAVREQSAQFQGSSFAGSAAGGALSSSFWNSAAISQAGSGLQSESAYSLILPDAKVVAYPGTQVTPVGSDPIGQEVDFGRMAVVPASYYAYRLNTQTVVGIAINSPFGLGNEFESATWAGQQHGRSGKIFTTNVNPMMSYNLMPNLAIGVGLQVQYSSINFKAQPSAPGGAAVPSQSSIGFEVDDIGFGGTAGVLWSPARGTDIGIGYRSPISHSLEGDLYKVGDSLNLGPVSTTFKSVGLKADITLPEMVTISLRQALSPTTRLLGTVEWTHWSRLTTVDFVATSNGGAGAFTAPIASGQVVNRFDFNWNDGWLFALGGEWDYSSNLTLRAGVGYEISPVQNADQRFTLITDSDRTWLSGGLTYKLTQNTSIDLGYTHIFFADAPIDRASTTNPANTGGRFVGEAKQSVDILSAGLKMKW